MEINSFSNMGSRRGGKCCPSFYVWSGLDARNTIVEPSLHIPYVQGRKELFYLTAHSAHFIYGYVASNIWQRTTRIERKPDTATWGYLFQQEFFYMHYTTGRTTPILEHWLEQEIAQWVHHEGSIWWPITSWVNALTTELYLASLLLLGPHSYFPF